MLLSMLVPICRIVSARKIEMWKFYRRRRTQWHDNSRHPAPIKSNSLNMLYILSKRLKVTITRIVIAKKCLSFRNANTINNTRSTYNLYASKILIDLREQSFTNAGKNWEKIKRCLPRLKLKKCFKIPNGKSEAVTRMTDSTMNK
jgi:hypothetical protein